MLSQIRTVHHLEGLQTQPLASYLTALGVLRLLHEQKDSTVSGAWSDGHFVLDTELDRAQLLRFFLEEYRPTPLTSPWNGGSGYYEKDNKEGFHAILASDHPRFAPYRKTLEQVQAILTRLGAKDKPDGEDSKTKLLRTLRGELEDCSLKWLDAAVVLSDDEHGRPKPRYAPLLGTGGNDGRLEFSNNQMKRLEEMFLSSKARPKENAELLEAALFGTVSRFLKGGPIGQFDPGSAGGVNLSVGFEGAALVNPWYYILMIEGALVLASAAVGRFKDPGRSGSAFPFTVNHLGAGNGKLGVDEGNRQEIWLPLWGELSGYAEIQGLFAEGRAQVGPQQARNPIEFSLALASHGISRGLAGFSRFGFLQRNGKSFFATPLGYHPVRPKDSAGLLRRLERWFSSYRHQLKKPESVGRAIRRYDSAVMEHLSTGRKKSLTDVLERLGELHILICRAPKLWEIVRPLPRLDNDWITAAYDKSTEFRLALALSTLGGGSKTAGLHLRSQLSPYDSQMGKWNDRGWISRWVGRDVPERMLGLLRHRLIAAGKANETAPIWGLYTATRADIEDFIEGRIDDQRLERLLYALCLVPAATHDIDRRRPPDFLTLPYLLPKLAMHQGRPLRSRPDQAPDGPSGRDRRVPPTHIVQLLTTGKVGSALKESRRFLLGRGLIIPTSLTGHQPLPPTDCRRLAAALLFPISDVAYQQIALNILKLESEIARKERED